VEVPYKFKGLVPEHAVHGEEARTRTAPARQHIDEHLDGNLEIRYDYPFSVPHALPEQVIRLVPEEVPQQLRADLTELRNWLRARLDVRPVRIPHGEILPATRDGILTVVIQDQRRALPIVRLYCYETTQQLGSQVERELRMEASDFTPAQRAVWKRVQQEIKGMAWKNFQEKLSDR
jgi:hypothetical protein